MAIWIFVKARKFCFEANFDVRFFRLNFEFSIWGKTLFQKQIQIRKLKKRTDEVKDSQKEFENSLRETVKSMSFADLGKQLKKMMQN